MSDTTFILGFLAATLLPALLVASLVRRWAKGVVRLVIAAALVLGVARLGMGAFVSRALPDLGMPMD
ncbi:hypothetical protein Rumeso_00451 [Rubellimicrobium mesophilum DSM 19309]|uniref:Uncharacterized protein n=1 Tax=Rubellimicrobium mesophilum DSM 19309 TaxID=442562 RepID=A0A017HUJ0_9RHOB|nr:hypothetical protein [Rubellimicrobium mesophilum]EYD77990.1 hypothetical protein Rumeso_00451 [Rubellimicrobium mesophilum DSM 19309]